MRSELQIEASRANGSKSRGPITEEGKIASSRNAVKHGLLSQTVLLHGECQETFDAFNEEFVATLQPANPVEADLVNTMVVARWGRMRTWHLEKTTLQIQMDREYDKNPASACKPEVLASIAFSFLADNSRSLDLLNRYESRYDRQYHRAFHRLLAIRKNPMPTPPAPLPLPDSAGFRSAPSVSAGNSNSAGFDSAPSVSAGNSNSAERTQASPGSGSPDIIPGTGPAAVTLNSIGILTTPSVSAGNLISANSTPSISAGNPTLNSAKRTQAAPATTSSSRPFWLETYPERAPAPLVFRAQGGLAPS